MVCVVYSSRICPKCEVLKRVLQDHEIEHMVRMIEEPDVKVDALMLNIYSTPALVVGNRVLRQNDLFSNDRIDEAALITFLRSHRHGETAAKANQQIP